jgi:Protein of unknown function (DUF2851)
MKEDFLHYLWRFKRFEALQLTTTTGENIEIVDFGEYNRNAGPDFLNARIIIGDTTWYGNVEMHLKSSDWLLHKHQHDPNYANVILHVVLEDDQPIYDKHENRLPCLVLKPYLKENLLHAYQQLLHNAHWIPCQHHFYTVGEMVKNSWFSRLLIERLEEKTSVFEQNLLQNKMHWEEVFYQALAKNFGLKVNAMPFEMLAASLPQIILAKHKDNLFQLEALLFGQAGLLEADFEEPYPQQLKKEYQYLRHKHQLTPILATMWKFSKLRPSNFPTIRIAQMATLIFQSEYLFSKILEAKTLKDLRTLFEVKISDYWSEHYVFDKKSKKINKSLGENTIDLLLINTVLPFIFLYGKMNQQALYKDRAIEFLEALPAEDNAIIENWERLGVEATSAATTQSLLQLKNQYCNQQRCLHCAVGISIMKQN